MVTAPSKNSLTGCLKGIDYLGGSGNAASVEKKVPMSSKEFLKVVRLRRSDDARGSYILNFAGSSFAITSTQIRTRREFLGAFWDSGLEAPNVPPLGPRYDDFAAAVMAKLYCRVQGEHQTAVSDVLASASVSLDKEDLLTGAVLALNGKMYVYPAVLLREARKTSSFVSTHDVAHTMRELGWHKSSVRVGLSTYGVWAREQSGEESDDFSRLPLTGHEQESGNDEYPDLIF